MRPTHPSILVIIVVLFAAPLVIFETNTAYGQTPIYIRSNGTIEPSNANITRPDQQTYVFTSNINDPIIIQRSNIILDGASYSLTAPASQQAIYIYSLTNVTITGMRITNSNRAILVNSSSNTVIYNNLIMNNYRGIELTGNAQYNNISLNYISNNNDGIYLESHSSQNAILGNNIVGNSGCGISIGTWSSSNTISRNELNNNNDTGLLISQSPGCTVTDNEISTNYYGVRLMYVNTTHLRNNQILNNHCNFGLYFNGYSDLLNDIDETNYVNFKPIYYWVDKKELTVPTDASIVILNNCTDILIRNTNFTDPVWQAVVIGYSVNVNVTSCFVEGGDERIENCIQVLGSTDCTIENNYLHGFVGIELDYSNNNTIFDNMITGSGDQGAVKLESSQNNLFYHNNFTNNVIDVLPDGVSSNRWDNGYLDGGNYWSNYGVQVSNPTDNYSGPNQNQPGADGFWDTAYSINGNNIDHYPEVPEFSTVMIFAFLIFATIAVITLRRKESRPLVSLQE